MFHLKGSIVAIVTPFNGDGSVNFDRLGELIEWHIANKTDGIVVLGTTGESATMTTEEDDAVCEYTIRRVGGRIPVIAGAGSNCTQYSLDKSIRFQQMGADALLLITPYYNKANEEGMYRHFATVADQVNIPCILYNVPGRTGCALSESVVARLAKHQNIAGIKEASGNISYTAKIARYVNEDFALYSGNDDMIVPILSLGGSGVISVFANIMPRESHEIVAEYLAGNVQKACALQLKYLEVINDLFLEVNPIPVKAAMNMLGLGAGPVRLPLYEMSGDAQAKLRAALQKVGAL